jgi:hypothetical protein
MTAEGVIVQQDVLVLSEYVSLSATSQCTKLNDNTFNIGANPAKCAALEIICSRCRLKARMQCKSNH